MFVREIISPTRYVDGKKFVERILQSHFASGDVSITTIMMNDRPLMKQYEIKQGGILKRFWKSLRDKNRGFDRLA